MCTSPACCSSRSGRADVGRLTRPRQRQLQGRHLLPAGRGGPGRPGRRLRAPRRRAGAGLRRPRGGHRSPAPAGGDRGTERARLDDRRVHVLYPDGATALHRALERFDGGRLVVNVIDMPIKCPVAPLEFCFLADGYFRRRGIRDRVELSYVTPLDGAFTKPVCNRELSGLLAAKGIELVTEFNTGTVTGRAAGASRLISYDDREVPFDLAVVIPLHGGAAYVGRSPGLGDELGFIPVDPAAPCRPRPSPTCSPSATPPTCRRPRRARSPTSRASPGRQRAPFLAGQPVAPPSTATPTASSRPAAARPCSSTSTTTPSRSPGTTRARLGLPLLRESRLNHLGKLAFQQFYWHSLLPGRDIPGISSAMPPRGKRLPPGLAASRRPSQRLTDASPRKEDATMPDASYARPERRRSTTKASSPTRPSGPRTWRRRSPRPRASTS